MPGEISDYHFAIQQAADELWKRRRDQPAQIGFVEWLSWWDARLVETHPEAFENPPGSGEYLRVPAFERIVGLYEREGFLHEALAAAERFEKFGGINVADLRARVAQLREEHE